MFADDGIMYANDPEDIVKVLKDRKLKQVGIVFSQKIKKDGTPATAFIENEEVEFLGAKLDFKTGMVSSEKGKCHYTSPNLQKII